MKRARGWREYVPCAEGEKADDVTSVRIDQPRASAGGGTYPGNMARKDAHHDPRLTVARYQVDRLDGDSEEDDPDTAGQTTMDKRAQYVELAIQQAVRSGDFDDLPGAGKPIPGLGVPHHPDWWIRRKIEREQLTGLGPPALTLRAENAALDERLDATASERVVRDLLDDFNRRVIEARRQLQGGPPVVTPTRDVEAEVDRWRERREARQRAAEEERARAEAAYAALSRRERRALRRRTG